MKKTFKGFTLVECIIAMTILAFACMTLGGIEAAVAKRNNANHFNNTSLANQMAFVEQYTGTKAVPVYYGGADASGKPKKDTHINTDKKPPHEYQSSNNGEKAYIQIQKLDSSKNVVSTDKYSFPVDIYVLYTRDNNNVGSNGMDADTVANNGKGNTATYGTIAGSITNENIIDQGSGKSYDSNLRYKYIVGHTGS